MDPLSDSQIQELAKTLTNKQGATEILKNFLPPTSVKAKLKCWFEQWTNWFISKGLLASHFKQWPPLDTIGDGNCLYNCVRWNLGLLEISHRTIFLSKQKAADTFNGDFSKVLQSIEALARQTARPGIYSRQFHILALTSVIKRPICAA